MMQAHGAHEVSFLFAVAIAAGAWLSGAVFGWGLRETRAWIGEVRAPAISRPRERARPKARARPDGQRRRSGGYYFSEEARGWGDSRWRRRLGWVSAVLILVMLGGALVVAVASYKPTRLPSAGAHRHR